MRNIFVLLLAFFVFTTNASAEEEYKEPSRLQMIARDIRDTWNNPTAYNLYIPIYAWHNRLTYDKEHIDEYNEEPWGGGLGISRYDEDGDWHGIYAMAFKDSNNYMQTIAGYAFQKNWDLSNNGDFKGGIGYTLSLTQRHEYSYIPVPLPLPLVGLSYKQVSLQAAYVPGIKNDGNVLFSWLRVDFPK